MAITPVYTKKLTVPEVIVDYSQISANGGILGIRNAYNDKKTEMGF